MGETGSYINKTGKEFSRLIFHIGTSQFINIMLFLDKNNRKISVLLQPYNVAAAVKMHTETRSTIMVGQLALGRFLRIRD